jgi:hypothetical protein
MVPVTSLVLRSLVVCALLLLLPRIASAEQATVQLKQGGKVSGELIEYVPGDHLILELGTGQPLPIAASNIKALRMGSSAGSGAVGERLTSGLNLGLRLGYALPWGRLAGGSYPSVSHFVTGQVPITVDVGYHWEHLVIGLQFHYGFASVADQACLRGFDCGVKDLRLGLVLEYRLSPSARMDPWVSAGIGFEWLSLSSEEPESGMMSSGGFQGLELLAVQAGLDWRVAEHVSAGPYVGLSFGQFSSQWQNDAASQDLTSTALHGWITFGVRGTYDLQLPRMN